ncbi:dihydroorotase family protein [Halalkalicoccus sp. NIPERK01]|uniref:dihydroorotase n=1 Tax=Halalkalicoccus sp. NIPERK01 TaxID=3053469 RepID=UPI00256F5C59|nr:amidohydrolase family protein [Halalkalicoccus sp. NIPERK01]MDL5363240.1 amidohydrolase family protein [Halalkalicoccus sp. NIPERK01]
MAVETVIENGTIVTGRDTFDGALAIDDGTIVSIGAEHAMPETERTVDASGLLVMSGVVDPHVHIDDHVSLDTYETATSAAALGGVTTVIDFAWQAYTGAGSPWDETGSLREGVERKRENGSEAVVDFGLHGGILREDSALFEEMGPLVDEGITSFKMYTTYEFGLSNGFIREVLERLRELDAVGVAHTEDDSVCESLTTEFRTEGRDDPKWLPEARPDYAEAMAADDVARLASETGAKYYGIHTSCRKAAEALARYRDDGSRIRGETCTHYTTLTDEIYRELGNLPKIAPPIRTEDDTDAMFEYLRNDTLSVVSTDHVAQTRERKETSEWWEDPFGANGLQTSLPVFHDEAVNNRGLSYPFLVRVMCANPARTFGLAKKGTLQPGTDADIVLFDPNETYTISARNNASVADYTIYEGRDVTGKVKRTYLRGQLVADEGNVVGEPGHGEFVPRERPVWSDE